MSYPKWRHHPTKESVIVYDAGVCESQTPDEDGWRDDRLFPTDEAPEVEEPASETPDAPVTPAKPKGKPGRKPKGK